MFFNSSRYSLFAKVPNFPDSISTGEVTNIFGIERSRSFNLLSINCINNSFPFFGA